MGIRRQVLKATDRFVIGCTELAKALVRESFRLGQQLTDSTSAAIMQVVNNDAYYAARRNRIHPGPEIVEKAPDRKMSNFGYVLLANSQDYDETWDSPEYRNVSFVTRESPGTKPERNDAISETTVATEKSIPQQVIELLNAFGRWVVNRIVSMLHLLLMWVPGMGSRAERLASMLGREERRGGGAREFEIDHEHTGLLEDVQTRLHMWIEWSCWVVRRCLYMLLGSRGDREVVDLLSRNLTLRDFRAHTLRRNQNFDNIVRRAGYPFEKNLVSTDDGYQLELHRLPKPESNRVMFLQHGIMDSSYSFVAKGASDGLAFRAFDKGYDVFMGNFRGTSALKHRSDDISAKEYWDFTLDDHANFDIDAFVKEICRIKAKDLGGGGETLDITLVAHSMGAAASLIYVVNKKRGGQDHKLSRMVMMSPAGYHQRIPRMCRYLGPLLDGTLSQWTYTLSIPSEAARQLSSKLVTDAVGLPALRDVIYSFGEMFLGGDFKSTLHPHVKTVTENMIAGTSSKVFRQFWKCYVKGKFLSYDHGPEGNLKAYGTETPVDYMSHYNLVDIPIHFMAGQNDKLIPAKDCFKHYKTLHRHSPHLATCKPFEGRGHIDFTYGLDQEMTNEIFTHAAPPRPQPSPAADPGVASPVARLASPRRRTGTTGIVLGPALRVAEVRPGSSAARSAVIHIGDQITSINKEVVVGQAPEQVMKAMSGPAGEEISVGFTRNGAHKKAALILE